MFVVKCGQATMLARTSAINKCHEAQHGRTGYVYEILKLRLISDF